MIVIIIMIIVVCRKHFLSDLGKTVTSLAVWPLGGAVKASC